jgi:membrane protein
MPESERREPVGEPVVAEERVSNEEPSSVATETEAAAPTDPKRAEDGEPRAEDGEESGDKLGFQPGDPRQRPRPEPFYEPWADPHRPWQVTPSPTSHSGVALEVERRVLGVSRFVDRAQSRLPPIAFGYAVFKKYADDEGSRLAALLAYYTFLSLFPLAIGGFAFLNTMLRDRPDLVLEVVRDIVPAEYEQQIINAYEALPDSGAGLAIAIVGLLLSGTAGVFSLYAMINQVFCVPYRFRFGFGPRYIRVFLLVFLMGVGTLVVVVGSAVVANVGHIAAIQRIGGFVLIWIVAASLLYIAPNVLARRPLSVVEVAPGAALGGLAITALVSLSSVILGRFITTSSAVYGAFATVVGIFSALFLVSNALVFCYEIGVVAAWRLWPRGVDIQLLFPADERAYALLTLMDERMPSQRNGLMFDATGHEDPRRTDLGTVMRRPPGVPRTPYQASEAAERDGAGTSGLHSDNES